MPAFRGSFPLRIACMVSGRPVGPSAVIVSLPDSSRGHCKLSVRANMPVTSDWSPKRDRVADGLPPPPEPEQELVAQEVPVAFLLVPPGDLGRGVVRMKHGRDRLIERLAAFGLGGPIAGTPAGRHRLQLQPEGPREEVAAEIGRRAAGAAEIEDAVAGVPEHGELLHAEEAAAADLVFATGLDRLAGLLPLGLCRPAVGFVGRQGGQFKLPPGLADGRGNLVRIDADRTIRGPRR